MPTYEYACTECGHQFEAFQSFSEDALTQCPECKGEVQKVYSNVGVVFKGSGFYKTDSRATKPAATAGSATLFPASIMKMIAGSFTLKVSVK